MEWLTSFPSNQIKAVAYNPKTTDLPFDVAPIVIWASVEVNLAVIAACLPLLRPIFSRLLAGVHIGSSNNKSSGAGITGDYQHSRPKSFVRIGTLNGTKTGASNVGGRSKASDDADSTYELARSPVHSEGGFPAGNNSADSMERGVHAVRGFDGHGGSGNTTTITGAPDGPRGGWGSISGTSGGIVVKNEMSIQVSHRAAN